MKSARLILAAGCFGAALACGDLGDPDDGSPLAVIEGQLSQASASASASAPSNVRVAVVWNTSTSGFKTSVDVPASAVFPSKFRLELRDPPPETAMVRSSDAPPASPPQDNPGTGTQSRPLDAQGASNYAIAVGSVVAYEDLDGDGSLGLIDPDTAPTDRVLGSNDELLIVYVEGDPSAAAAAGGITGPSRGYNLLRVPRCPARNRSGSGPEVCPPSVYLPISTPFDLPLTAEPQLAEQMCRSAIGSSSASPTTRVEPQPAPGSHGWPDRNDPHVVCKADGKSYSYFRCVSTSKGLCKGAHETCTEESFTLPSVPPPAEWPCPAQ